MMKVFEHEHPLKLIDLQNKLEESDDDEDEEKDFVIQDEFSCTCKRCGEEINEYNRYYYKCIINDDSCVYHLHKFCAKLPKTLKHTSHPHPLDLFPSALFYACPSFCFFIIDVKYVVEKDIRRIHHPSHPHPLMSLISKPILCNCKACGIEHTGVFFQCTKCLDFAINTHCIKLPKSLLIQQTTNHIFRHTHPLTLSYSFPLKEQEAKYLPTCRVCGTHLFYHPNLWIYKCEKCIYYAHVNCATPRKEPFMYILNAGRDTPTVKIFIDADYPNLLHLPFPDETYSITRHLFFNETRPTTDEVSINHQHDLLLVDTEYTNSLRGSKIDSLIMCHNPMKKIQLLCNGCLRPITEMPFYKCGANEDERCNFAFHAWCTRLPTKVDNHPDHPQHTLVLMSNVVPHVFFNIFYCGVCRLPCNGYAYGCLECKYYVDVCCAFIPEQITHKSHPCHLLSRILKTRGIAKCIICLSYINWDAIDPISLKRLAFSCSICDVYIHPWCAMLFPETIRHAYDKHPMHLSYLPIENHKSEYFCEICENELNPHFSFYHCVECVQSVHCACAPSILRCETETYSCNWAWYRNTIYWFLNVKFGGIHKTDKHPHPLTFDQGIESDGGCSMCGKRMQYTMIFKCAECDFAVHYKCCQDLNNS